MSERKPSAGGLRFWRGARTSCSMETGVLTCAQDCSAHSGTALLPPPPLREEGRGSWGAGAQILTILFLSEAAAQSHLKLLSTVAQAVKGQGTICWVDCG